MQMLEYSGRCRFEEGRLNWFWEIEIGVAAKARIFKMCFQRCRWQLFPQIIPAKSIASVMFC